MAFKGDLIIQKGGYRASLLFPKGITSSCFFAENIA